MQEIENKSGIAHRIKLELFHLKLRYLLLSFPGKKRDKDIHCVGAAAVRACTEAQVG